MWDKPTTGKTSSPTHAMTRGNRYLGQVLKSAMKLQFFEMEALCFAISATTFWACNRARQYSNATPAVVLAYRDDAYLVRLKQWRFLLQHAFRIAHALVESGQQLRPVREDGLSRMFRLDGRTMSTRRRMRPAAASV